jgi:Ca-activated chloride channel homolog
MFRLSALALGLAAAAVAQETPTFSVDVKLVNVIATVKDAGGRPLGGLEKENFRLLADGVPQEIALFERQTDRPLSVALLFDASLSVAKEMRFEQEAALRFARSLLGAGAHAADRISIFSFSSYVDQVERFTASLDRLKLALSRIRPESGTSVYDALTLAADTLSPREGRKVIIIITDGGDTTSTATYHEALRAAQLADVVVYSIIVVPVTSDAGRNLGGENALKTISGSTGGLWFRQHGEQDLNEAFQEIQRDLRVQYLLGFYPRGMPADPGKYHRLEIQVNREGVRVLARSGYYSSPERPGRRNTRSNH